MKAKQMSPFRYSTYNCAPTQASMVVIDESSRHERATSFHVMPSCFSLVQSTLLCVLSL